MFLKLLLYQLFSILCVGAAASPRILRSPCPDIFSYERIPLDGYHDWLFPSEDHRWRGVITVPKALPISLKVKLLAPVALPSKYVGRIELSQNKSEIVKKINSGNLQKIKYYVYFPAKIPIPELIFIEVNSRIVCSQPTVPRRIKTILTLEHSLTPLAANLTLRDGLGLSKVPVSGKGLEKPAEGTLRRCGRGILNDPKFYSNRSIQKGDWPWMVPLFRKTELGLQFLCSSTLISNDFVVTAAHCIQPKNSVTLRKEDIVAYVGRFNIKNWTEDNSHPRELNEIFIHPDYDPENLHSDLALLRFSRPVQLSSFVNPVCLWQGEPDLNAVVGKKGLVFGWGTDGKGNKITATPNLAVMPIVSQEECLRSKMEFLYLTSNRTLCAGFRNGTGPCNGDSGGGLLIPRMEEDGVISWVLRGVVSLSLLQKNQLMCDVHEYTVFTDVAKYQTWIAEQINRK